VRAATAQKSQCHLSLGGAPAGVVGRASVPLRVGPGRTSCPCRCGPGNFFSVWEGHLSATRQPGRVRFSVPYPTRGGCTQGSPCCGEKIPRDFVSRYSWYVAAHCCLASSAYPFRSVGNRTMRAVAIGSAIFFLSYLSFGSSGWILKIA
jgi:hypothetical protein